MLPLQIIQDIKKQIKTNKRPLENKFQGSFLCYNFNMNDKFKEKYLELKLANRAVCLNIDVNNYNSDTELLNSLAAGIQNEKAIVILNGNGLTDREFVKLGEKVKLLCAEFDATLLIHNRTDISFLLDADGVYLDENGVSTIQAHKILGDNTIILDQSSDSKYKML